MLGHQSLSTALNIPSRFPNPFSTVTSGMMIVHLRPTTAYTSTTWATVCLAGWFLGHLLTTNCIAVQHVNKKARWWAQNPSSLRPPEVIFGTSLTQKVDVWMLGCATFLLLTGESLFSPEPQSDADYLARITQLTGESFDAVVWKGSSRYDEFFLQSGKLLLTCQRCPRVPLLTSLSTGQLKNDLTDDGNPALEERLSRLSVDDVKPAAEFIAYCLKVDPAERPSTLDLMDHSWLTSGYECSCGYCMR